MDSRLQEIEKFIAANGFAGADIVPLAGDASFRRYVRLHHNDQRALVMDAPPGKEDVRPYLKVARHLHAQGYSTPKILAQDEARGLIALEDFGSDSFTSLLKAPGGDAKEEELYAAAIDVLVEWHHRRAAVSDARSLPLAPYDEKLLMQEALLFSNWYLPQVVEMDRVPQLRAEYAALWQEILKASALSRDHFVHRDYHADNLMWLPGREGTKRVGLLDFQDAVYGDAAYDVVSLLEDARRDVPEHIVQAMLRRYIERAQVDAVQFMQAYALLGAQRNSKIVGIFVRLGARDNKHHYVQYLPRVWRHLERDLAHPALAALKRWVDANIPPEARGAIPIRHNSRELALSA